MFNASYEKDQILKYYNDGAEIGRLYRGIGKIEFERTKEIVLRYITDERKVIYDIGGGIGVYSNWLANLGHEVHMFELAPNAVQYAKDVNNRNNQTIYKIEVADARDINRPDESADVVLLMGPLYHLTEKEERIKSLMEASRILKKDGFLIVSAISRFGSTLWGLSVFGQNNEYINEADFMKMLERELTDGQHIRPNNKKYDIHIPRAFFHTPNELKEEIELAGFYHEKTIAVEGPVWIVPTFEEKWEQEVSKRNLLKISRLVEEQESLMGVSPHMLAICRK
ncbi:bifunctional 2-polyprenyl-6-hydroxyphenol methylase/3-demethylubiquinol 3-O-methyltransferase UbiG [Bacillus sp. 03113]|uniref:class I SAM-dependent methyltransferase n=1 Tax=Bacillus sp. 03113 TaxID=2578211 RepID=UPI0011443BDB|nr:class I SAM-dependent methyltransferase [Bacillus sp. 03113]